MSLQRVFQVFSVVEEYLKRRQEFISNLTEERQLRDYFINSNVSIIVLSQVIVLLLSGLTVMSTILIALIPVNLFFLLTTANSTSSTYAFLVLLNVLIFVVAGFFALVYLLRGFMALYPGGEWILSFLIGGFIFVFVGTQLAWVLRPYFHYYEAFIRPLESNFYVAIIELIFRAFRGGFD